MTFKIPVCQTSQQTTTTKGKKSSSNVLVTTKPQDKKFNKEQATDSTGQSLTADFCTYKPQ